MIALTSTLSDIITEFVVLDANYDPAQAEIVTDPTSIKIFWGDTSRIRLDVSVMSITPAGVTMVVPPVVNVPGGENPNNP